ncbi:MAG: GNAT family N-acetyltransferase [Firmicutes bacterium]|nr:GNAT family N-acetyltransferase [Bacillota bacterium]
MFRVRYVMPGDRDFWFSLDRHLSTEGFDEKVTTRRGYVLLKDEEPVGILRYGLFWDEIPFCNLLYVREDARGQGGGKILMEHWEQDMLSQGYSLVMTSTQADEEAQHFYRAIGYRDCGGLVLNNRPYAQPMELLMVKNLHAERYNI